MLNLRREYTELIGGGGFGTVYSSPNNPTIAVKFLDREDCPNADVEFKKAKNIYNAFKIYLVCLKVDFDIQIKIPKVFNFVQDDPEDGCAVVMERLVSPEPSIIHIILSDNLLPNQLNQIHYSNGKERGYYASPSKIMEILNNTPSMKGNLNSLSDISQRIGEIQGFIMFGAGYSVTDIEFILAVNPNTGLFTVSALDFGLVEPLNIFYSGEIDDELVHHAIKEAEEIANIIDYDSYFTPCAINSEVEREEAQEMIESYFKGLESAYLCYRKEVIPEFYETLIRLLKEC